MKLYIQAFTGSDSPDQPILSAGEQIKVSNNFITYSDVLAEIEVDITIDDAKQALKKAYNEQKALRIAALKEQLAKEEAA